MIEMARRFLLHGAVQGCGLRPALARMAAANHWSGSVRNTTNGVELILCGVLPSDERLLAAISEIIPSSAVIEECISESPGEMKKNGFQIVESTTTGPLAVPLPRDLTICGDCLRETRDPNNRRFRYPFTTCAQCGPRYSMLLTMPFDRARTTMGAFDMCHECQQEYHDPLDRRFHAQTISCSHCGPLLWTSNGRELLHIRSRDALNAAVECLHSGLIVSMRGVGGYQLLVDATSSSAVTRLRRLKRRRAKPFAVLCRTLEEVRQLAYMSNEEEIQLCSAANPIVLVRQRPATALAPQINPGLSDIGLMLPTTALHDLLLERAGFPLVCTSGNLDGEPLAYRVDDAENRLLGIADLFLNHDREIHRPIDDSVVRVIANRPVSIRAARGIAPLPLSLTDQWHAEPPMQIVLACGGHQKSAVAMTNGVQAMLAPHVGDVDSLSTQDRWDDHVRELGDTLTDEDSRQSYSAIACDPHSGYFPTNWAMTKSNSTQHVWHHHAHVVTGMLEHHWLDREVLGVAWDGTGLGSDGTIWGGEFLHATATRFQRVAQLRPFVLPGGEFAITDLRRLGVAVLSQLDEVVPSNIASLLDMTERDVCRIRQTMTSEFGTTTTSVGRLFDVAALLILDQTKSEFEGHAAMCLEAACELPASGAYHFDIDARPPMQIDWRPVVSQILADRRANKPRGAMAMRFHRGLAKVILDVAKHFPELPVVLGGGVFQNRVLVELVAAIWPVDGPLLGLPGMIPPNDGGLAAGQLAVAVASTTDECRRIYQETIHVPGSSGATCTVD